MESKIMARSNYTRIRHLCTEGLGIVIRIILGLILVPLAIVLYALCWIRVKLTARIYCNENRSLLSSSDVMLLLHIDHIAIIVNEVIVTRSHFSLDAMKELFVNKVLNAKDTNNRPLFPKFTRYVDLCAGYLMWIEEINFNVDDHIRLYRGQTPNNEELLKNVINEICNENLPSTKSGWEIVVIEYRQSDVQKSCIVLRVHHCMADGISIFRLVIEQMAGNHGAFQHILKQMQSKFEPQFDNALLNMLVNVGRIVFDYIIKGPRLPIDHNSKECELRDTGYIDWTSSIKMDTIRRIKDVTSTTVNDVLASCMAGAFRKYFVKHDICPPDSCTTLIPFSDHGPDDPVRMSNKVNGLWMSMPTGDMDCLQRLKATKVEMDQLKRSPDNISHHWFQCYFANVIPYTIVRQVFDFLHFTIAFSNMPGPTTQAAFNGNTIESLFLATIPSSRIGFAVFVFTYAGSVTVAVSVDKARVSSREDLSQLLDDFVEEVDQLYNSVIRHSPNMMSLTLDNDMFPFNLRGERVPLTHSLTCNQARRQNFRVPGSMLQY